ncbi:ABC transporter permease [Aestuariivirga sp. YIM B02566]|uniref:ABC transporter permease n=1 Tax=Taklimakanibacter albus TaxID=2800327 RepID=A0ACC5R6B1_9HYPH|nr:ABC transporter permease [Aestuariivirga sp. YIM B02566]MBK1868205.1 ABC transporter permease [Aestuariivirga sp. YIM B02566]
MPSGALEIVKRVTRDPFGLLGLVLVIIVLGAAIFADVIAPYDPAKIDIINKLQGPSAAHWLGTDQLGRDTLSRIIYGARVAMGIAVFSIGIGAFIGLILGILAGYGPRWLDALLIFFFDSLNAIPLILFALTVIVILGPGTSTLIFVIAVISIPVYGRLVRAQTLSLRRSEFILAEQAMGASLPRIVGIHLLPNVLGPLVILVSMDIPSVVALEAALSYLGLGVKPPTPSWGTILNDGYTSLRSNPALVIAAGIPLVIATLGFTFLGEALRDALDPKLKTRRTP